jgi:hypothetical protein
MMIGATASSDPPSPPVFADASTPFGQSVCLSLVRSIAQGKTPTSRSAFVVRMARRVSGDRSAWR